MIIMEIDVSKIDKDRFYAGYNGVKTLSLVLIETPKGKSDYMVKQGASKEERESKNYPDLPILGNAKIISKGGGKSPRKNNGGDWPVNQGKEDW
jgi:hypothetical protein